MISVLWRQIILKIGTTQVCFKAESETVVRLQRSNNRRLWSERGGSMRAHDSSDKKAIPGR